MSPLRGFLDTGLFAGRHGWITRFAGIVEPSIQVHLGHVTREMVSEMDRVAIQYVAFKRDREFKLKAPVAVEYAVDTTKFFKLHCFHDNIYFASPPTTRFLSEV